MRRLCHKDTLLVHVQPGVHQDPQPVRAKLLSSIHPQHMVVQAVVPSLVQNFMV